MPGSEYGNIPFADEIKALIDALETTISTLITNLETAIESLDTTISNLQTALAEYDFEGLYKQWNFIASDTLLQSSDAISSSSGAWAKVKEFTFNPTNSASVNTAGFRFKWKQLQELSGLNYSRIYKNGTPWGVEHVTAYGTEWQQYSEDLTGAGVGDTFELWIYNVEGSTSVKEYRCYGDAELIVYDDPVWS